MGKTLRTAHAVWIETRNRSQPKTQRDGAR